MRFTSFLVGGILANLGFAYNDYFVEQEPLYASSCSTRRPTSYQQIFRRFPGESFPQSLLFKTSQEAGGKDNTDTLIRFSGIPAGSFGCQLAVSFPSGYPITSTGSAQLNVYALSRNITKDDTYETYFPNRGRGIPKYGFLWGTTTLIAGRTSVINSESCKPSLNYLFEIASETVAGDVSFVDGGNNQAGQFTGFFLQFNC